MRVSETRKSEDMKNPAFENGKPRKWKRMPMLCRLTLTDVRKAFTVASISTSERDAIVAKYMGNSPVPPSWSYVSVRGTFGKKVARIWARKLRHRPAGVYRDSESGRWLHPAVQTTYDFGITPRQTPDQDGIDTLKAKLTTTDCEILLDEFWRFGKTA